MTADTQKTYDFTLQRTGKAPLCFDGQVIAECSGHSEGPPHRWHDITVFRTVGGKWILDICYLSDWRDEPDHLLSQVFDTATALSAFLQAYDPLEYLKGFPPGPKYAQRQKQLRDNLKERFAEQVNEVLQAIPGTAEVVE